MAADKTPDPLDRVAVVLYGPAPQLSPQATNLDRLLYTGLRRASAAATVLIFGNEQQRAAVDRLLRAR